MSPKEQWKFSGRRRSRATGGDVYIWTCEERRQNRAEWVWAIPVSSLLAKP